MAPTAPMRSEDWSYEPTVPDDCQATRMLNLAANSTSFHLRSAAASAMLTSEDADGTLSPRSAWRKQPNNILPEGPSASYSCRSMRRSSSASHPMVHNDDFSAFLRKDGPEVAVNRVARAVQRDGRVSEESEEDGKDGGKDERTTPSQIVPLSSLHTRQYSLPDKPGDSVGGVLSRRMTDDSHAGGAGGAVSHTKSNGQKHLRFSEDHLGPSLGGPQGIDWLTTMGQAKAKAPPKSLAEALLTITDEVDGTPVIRRRGRGPRSVSVPRGVSLSSSEDSYSPAHRPRDRSSQAQHGSCLSSQEGMPGRNLMSELLSASPTLRGAHLPAMANSATSLPEDSYSSSSVGSSAKGALPLRATPPRHPGGSALSPTSDSASSPTYIENRNGRSAARNGSATLPPQAPEGRSPIKAVQSSIPSLPPLGGPRSSSNPRQRHLGGATAQSWPVTGPPVPMVTPAVLGARAGVGADDTMMMPQPPRAIRSRSSSYTGAGRLSREPSPIVGRPDGAGLSRGPSPMAGRLDRVRLSGHLSPMTGRPDGELKTRYVSPSEVLGRRRLPADVVLGHEDSTGGLAPRPPAPAYHPTTGPLREPSPSQMPARPMAKSIDGVAAGREGSRGRCMMRASADSLPLKELARAGGGSGAGAGGGAGGGRELVEGGGRIFHDHSPHKVQPPLQPPLQLPKHKARAASHRQRGPSPSKSPSAYELTPSVSPPVDNARVSQIGKSDFSRRNLSVPLNLGGVTSSSGNLTVPQGLVKKLSSDMARVMSNSSPGKLCESEEPRVSTTSRDPSPAGRCRPDPSALAAHLRKDLARRSANIAQLTNTLVGREEAGMHFIACPP